MRQVDKKILRMTHHSRRFRGSKAIIIVGVLCTMLGAQRVDAFWLRHFAMTNTTGTVMTEALNNGHGTYINSPDLNDGFYLTLNGTDQRGDVPVSTFLHSAYEVDRSLAMWIKLDNTNNAAHFLGTTVPPGGHGWSFGTLSNGKLRFLRPGVAAHDSSVVHGIQEDTWTHVGYTLSGSTLKFYVNGVQLGANVSAATSYLNNGTPVVSLGSNSSDFMAGSISDVRFYVKGFGSPADDDPNVANETSSVLSLADMASLAALTPEEPPKKGTMIIFN